MGEAIYKFTNESGTTSYAQTPPKVGTSYQLLVDGKIVDNGVIGKLSTKEAEVSDRRKAQSEKQAKVNAKAKALEADEHQALAKLKEKTEELNGAIDRLNGSRQRLFDDIQKGNAALSKVNTGQNVADYAVAAASIVGTGIVVIAAAPEIVAVGLVVGTAASVTGLVNDRFRPAEEKPLTKEAGDGADNVRTLLEAHEANNDYVEALEALESKGDFAIKTGGKVLGAAGGALTAGLALEHAQTEAEHLDPGGINSEAGLDGFGEKLDEFQPSFLQSQFGFDDDFKKKLEGELADTKSAQKQFEEADEAYEEAAAAYKITMVNGGELGRPALKRGDAQ